MTLSGHTWHAYSPSMFELASHPIQLVYSGVPYGLPSRSAKREGWYLSFNGSFADAKPWPSRDAAAAAIAQAFTCHVEASAKAD